MFYFCTFLFLFFHILLLAVLHTWIFCICTVPVAAHTRKAHSCTSIGSGCLDLAIAILFTVTPWPGFQFENILCGVHDDSLYSIFMVDIVPFVFYSAPFRASFP